MDSKHLKSDPSLHCLNGMYKPNDSNKILDNAYIAKTQPRLCICSLISAFYWVQLSLDLFGHQKGVFV